MNAAIILQCVTPNSLYQVQVTITRLTTEGEHKGNCLFAGLAIYQGFKENLLFCSNRSLWSSNTTGTSKDTSHVIPPFADMNVVLYSFPNYASVSISLIFSVTICTGVAINPCEYEAYCKGNSFNELVCKKYLNSLKTVNAQFILKVQNLKWFQTLHKFSYYTATGLLLKQKVPSCLQIYASSFVKARQDNIFEDIYYQYFLQTACLLTIFPTTNSHKIQFENWPMHASYVGKINRLEMVQFSGLGKIATSHLEKYTLKEENTKIVIEEKYFNTKYDISLKYDIKFNIGIVSGIYNGKDTEFNQIDLAFQGGSSSAITVSLIVHHLQIFKKIGVVSTLTSWEMFNIVSANFIVPLLNIHTKGKTKQLLNILNKFDSVAYGYSLYIEMKGNSFYSFKQKAILAKLKIQTTFCIPKFLTDGYNKIWDLKHRHYLIISDITESGTIEEYNTKLFAKIYDNHCRSMEQIRLDWSMDLHVSKFLKSRGLEVLLPGIYDKTEIHILDQNCSTGKSEDQFTIRWLNRRIMQTVNTSLLLNGKKYLIFSETKNKRKVYSWQEAEEFCIKFKSHLPILRSQSDVQDLINIILRAAWTGPIRMIFIGLQVS